MFHDWVHSVFVSPVLVNSATSTSWSTPASSTRPETLYLPSSPSTVVGSLLSVRAVILPLFAGTPAISGIVLMFTRRLDFATSIRTVPRLYEKRGGSQFVDISSNLT